MKTIVRYVGNPWEHKQDDYSKIARLLELLRTHPLDRSFEQYGNFINPHPVACVPVARFFKGFEQNRLPEYQATEPNPWDGLTSFSGNFNTYSAAFQIYTDDPELIQTLTNAIHANQKRPDYLSQPKPGAHRAHIMHFADGHHERME